MKELIEQVSDIAVFEKVVESYGSKLAEFKGGYKGACPLCNHTARETFHIGQLDGYSVPTYKCFHCGKSGTIFKFVQEKEGLVGNFKASLDRICNIVGIEVPSKKLTEEEIQAKVIAKKEQQRRWSIANQHYLDCLEFSDLSKAHTANLLTMDINDGKINDEHELEIINYAHYEANEVVNVEKKIGEKPNGLLTLIDMANKGDNGLLIAGTGSGKTYTTITHINANKDIKAIFVVPNASNVAQGMKEYGIPGAFGEELSALEAIKRNNISIMTWDKVAGLVDDSVDLSQYILILDEVHQTFIDLFRDKAVRGLNDVSERFRARLDITATPNRLDFKRYKYIVEYKQKQTTKYNVNVYSSVNKQSIVNILNQAKAGSVLWNDTKALEFLQSHTSLKSDIVTRATSETSELYKYITQDGNMGDYELLLNTIFITAGVNIVPVNGIEVTDVIVVGIKDISTIKQYIARFRDVSEINVHIFANFSKDENKTYSIERAVQYRLQELDEAVMELNANMMFGNDIQKHSAKASLKAFDIQGNPYIYDKESGLYKVNRTLTRGRAYAQYYDSRSIEQFVMLMGEYFDNIIIKGKPEVDEALDKEFKEAQKLAKEELEEAYSTLEDNKELIVGYNNYIDGTESVKLIRYSQEQNINVKAVIAETKILGLDALLGDRKIKKQNELYSKYVTEYSYTYDVAWKLSMLSDKARKSFINKMKHVAYREVIKRDDTLVNKSFAENRLYDIIIEHFRPGMCYQKQTLEQFIKDMNKKYKFFKALKINPISLMNMLNEIYKMESFETTDERKLRTYNNLPLSENKKGAIKCNRIVEFIGVKHLNDQLSVNSDDSTIQRCFIDPILRSLKLYVPPVVDETTITTIDPKIDNDYGSEQLSIFDVINAKLPV